MAWQDIYLICFVVGLGWTLLTLLMGGLHLHLPHMHTPGFHGAGGLHVGHSGVPHVSGGHVGSHAGPGSATSHLSQTPASSMHGRNHLGMTWMSSLLNPSAISVFLAWFGGAGYLLTRGAVLTFWMVLLVSIVTGAAGGFAIGWVMRLVMKHEKPLDPADYEMVGVLGTLTCLLRPGGVGEMVYVRDGARRPLPVRAERNELIERGTEVVVTRLENGVAFVRTWSDLAELSGMNSELKKV